MAARKDRAARGGRGRPQAKYSPAGKQQKTPWDNDAYVLTGLSEEAAEQRKMKALLRARRQLTDDLDRTNDRLERTLMAKKKRMLAHLKRTEREIQQQKFMEESGFVPATTGGFQSGRVTPPSAAEATASKWNGNAAAYRMALARKPRTATGAQHGDVSRLGQLMWQANYNPRSSMRDAFTPRILESKDPLVREHHRPRGEFSEYMKSCIMKHVNVKASGHG